MAKTYTAVTLANATAGNAILASDHYNVFQNVNNLIVPPMVEVRRTSGLTYTSETDVTWQSTTYDTDSMWSSGSATRVTIGTTGLYLINVYGDIRSTSSVTGFQYILTVNGTYTLLSGHQPVGQNGRYAASWVASLTAADYLQLRITVTTAGTITVNGSSTLQDQTRMSVTWIGRTS